MKKIISALLVGCLLLGTLAGCAPSPAKVDQALRERSIAMGQKLSAMAKNPDYRNLFGDWTITITTKFDEVAANEFQAPRAVFGLEFEEEAILSLLQQEGNSSIAQDPLELISKRMVVMVPQQINATAGVETLTVASIFSFENCFVEKGLTKPLLILSLYDGEWATAVGCRPGEDGAVNATATFLYGPSLKEVETVEQMQQWLSQQGYAQGVSVRQM